MSEQKKHKTSFWRWILGIIAVILVLVAAGRLALKSNWLFDVVRDIAIEQVHKQINGTLSIQSIRGDLLSGFTVTGIRLQDHEGGDILAADTVRVNYQIGSLITSPHFVDELSIVGLEMFAVQNQDSVWNFHSLLPGTTDTTETFFWHLENFSLSKVNIQIRSEQLLPDGQLMVETLQAEGTAGAGEQGFYGALRSLDFQLNEGRLPDPVGIWLAGSGNEQRVTLERFMIQTGRTFFEAAGEYRQYEGMEAEAALKPLSRRDLTAYLDDLPLQQDIQMELGASGRLSDLTLSLKVSASGLENLEIEAGADFEEAMVLKRLDIKSQTIDGPVLTGNNELPQISALSLTGEGQINLENIELSQWDGKLELSALSLDDFRFDEISARYQWQEEQGEINGLIVLNGEPVEIKGTAENLWGDMPAWSVWLTSDGLNLEALLHDPELESDLNLHANFRGQGTGPENFQAAFEVLATGNRIGGQFFSELSFRGTADPGRLDGILSGRLEKSSVFVDFVAENWQSDPAFEFVAQISEFNVEELNGPRDFPTYLNGTFRGSGRGTTPENLSLAATARFDSSLVNHEQIDTLRADFSIENEFFSVENAQFYSPVADVEFSLYQHLREFSNTDNRLDFNVLLKDLMPLAELFGMERLESRGNLNGNIARSGGRLEFQGNIELEDVVVDTLFRSAQVLGTVQGFIADEPEVNLDLELIDPMVYDRSVQDVYFRSHTVLAENEIRGNSGFTISDGENSLHHRGEFRVDSTSAELLTNALEFTTSLRTLRLSDPFLSTYSENVLRVDTLSIQSRNEDSYLKFWLPHVDSLHQQAGLDAKNLSLGAMQRPLISDPIFEGILSGSVQFSNSPDSLRIAASGLLQGFRYQAGEMDSLRLNTDLAEEWLAMNLEGWHEQEKLLEGALRVPFLPGDPLTFDDRFFDREISGLFNLNRSNLNYWLSFLPENDIEETGGIISGEAVLGGIAGNPELAGNLRVTNGLFSGIPVDSVGMDINYRHENEKIELDGRINAQSRRVLDFSGALPFIVDLKQGEVSMPADEDSIFVNVKTNDFDLALFRNYVDRDVIRNLAGKLDGEVTILGPLGSLHSEGRMTLSDGSMRILPAGITITDIGSRINVQSNNIELAQFSMRSGPGRIRATGSVGMDNLTPGEVQLRVIGNQFQVANTQEYNAIVNLEASLEGTIENPDLKGSVTFLNGFIFLQNFGERSVEDVQLDDEEEPEPFDFYDSMAMEMNVNFNRQFFIRNRQYLDMEIELAGQVDLIKERNRDVEIFGSLEGVDGYARPLGKNFELEEAVVSFFGPLNEPELNVRTLFEPPQRDTEVRIYYIIEGTALEPEFRFESEPELELQDIISYTLFGRPFYELESWQQTIAGNGTGGPSAADLAIDVLLDRVEILASQRLGIDVVQIDNSGSGSNSTTSIKTGWYLNRRTFFAILNEISSSRPKTLFILEYLLRENLELILTQGDDSREGIDLRWHYDY